MKDPNNWRLTREDVLTLLTNHLLYPMYSYQAIANGVGCNKKTVERYIRKWENDEDIHQLEPCDIIELKRSKMESNKIFDKLIYPAYVVTQIIIWGYVIYLIGHYNLTFNQTIFYFLSGELATIAFISFAIAPNVLIIMSLLEDKNEDETNISKAV